LRHARYRTATHYIWCVRTLTVTGVSQLGSFGRNLTTCHCCHSHSQVGVARYKYSVIRFAIMFLVCRARSSSSRSLCLASLLRCRNRAMRTLPSCNGNATFCPTTLSPVHTSNSVEATLSNATMSNVASTMLPFLATMSKQLLCNDFVVVGALMIGCTASMTTDA